MPSRKRVSSPADKELIVLLKDVVASIATPAAVGLVDLLYGKKNVNEFLIAKKLNLNINQTRNILYKLVDEGLVSFIRKKDRKNGGWYTYYWTLDSSKSIVNLRNTILKDIQHLEQKLGERKHQRFYYCPNCDLEMDEENALLNNFTCTECGEVLTLRDNSPLVQQFEAQIAKRRQQLAGVDAQLGTLTAKHSALRQRALKAEAKRKKEQRALKRKATAAAKKLSQKTSSRPIKGTKKRA